MGEEVQPLAQQAVDLLGRQAVADLLKPLGIGAAEHTIVEGLIGDALSLATLPEPALLRPLAEYERAAGGGWS